ncbi:HAD hydrolase-like protein [Propionibacterium australiense]|uniref:HAD hydrolase-like protein n=1 Tax=Propionibacterium australiense TaxID=119981 RepID=UPI0014772869|nr:HAD hydrolase-like protein [Propionibacterium australiense]
MVNKHAIVDVHGVLLGRQHYDASPPGDLISGLREAGYSVHIVTNSSSITAVDLASELVANGVPVCASDVVTMAMVAAHRLSSIGVSEVAVIGSDVLRAELERLVPDLKIVEVGESEVLLVTRDPALTEGTLDRIRRLPPRRIFATCKDAIFADASGIHAGPGATVRRVELAAGREAILVGKPDPYMITEYLGLRGDDLDTAVVIGDSLTEDAELAERAGCRALIIGTPEVTSCDLLNVARLDQALDILRGIE